MKVIAISNHGDETVADRLIKDKLTKEQANKIVEDYNSKVTEYSDGCVR